MIPIRGCQGNEVIEHWLKVERTKEDVNPYRGNIRCKLPVKIKWFLAEIEEKNLPKIFIISFEDWRPITRTFKLIEAVNALDRNIEDETARKHVRNIKEKRMVYEQDINGIDRRFILVAPSTNGNFTIIEGNKRAVALQSIGNLVGNQIYLGISNEMVNYYWARNSH